MPEKKVTSLVWFRNNLRVIDNLSLKKSVENSDKVIGYINIDPNIIKSTSYGFKKTEKFGFFSKLLRLLLNVTKVTTGHQKWPKMGQNS